jgi:hypothetical protein
MPMVFEGKTPAELARQLRIGWGRTRRACGFPRLAKRRASESSNAWEKIQLVATGWHPGPGVSTPRAAAKASSAGKMRESSGISGQGIDVRISVRELLAAAWPPNRKSFWRSL